MLLWALFHEPTMVQFYIGNNPHWWATNNVEHSRCTVYECSANIGLDRLVNSYGINSLGMCLPLCAALNLRGSEVLPLPCLLLLLCLACRCCCQAPGGEPVWRQLLQLCGDNTNPRVEQQAAAPLSDLTLE